MAILAQSNSQRLGMTRKKHACIAAGLGEHLVFIPNAEAPVGLRSGPAAGGRRAGCRVQAHMAASRRSRRLGLGRRSVPLSHQQLPSRPERTVAPAVGTAQTARLGPDLAAVAHPQVLARPRRQAVKGRMQALGNAAVDAEAAQHYLPIDARVGLSPVHDASAGVDKGGLGLQHVEVLGGAHAEADVALKVSRPVVVALFARAVLGEVLGCAHDKLGHVDGVGHVSGVYGAVQAAAHRGEVNEGLVVEVREDVALHLSGQPLEEGGHGWVAPGRRAVLLAVEEQMAVGTQALLLLSIGRRTTAGRRRVELGIDVGGSHSGRRGNSGEEDHGEGRCGGRRGYGHDGVGQGTRSTASVKRL